MADPAESQSQPSARLGIKSDRFSGLLLFLLALYIGWLNRKFPVGTLADPGPGYVPLLLAVALGGIGLLVIAFGGSSQPLRNIKWPEATRAVIILVACSVAAFALERIGYRLTIMALLVFFIGIIERRHPLAVVLVSAGFSLASYYVIGELLHVPLPLGPWGF
ncbi:MAG: tripartite tricarboxylate transporter TctB family protein [Burkholderiales bacterium]